MQVAQTMVRGGNDPDLSWTFTNSAGEPVPLPDAFELWIQPSASPRIELASGPGGALRIDRTLGKVWWPWTIDDAKAISKGTGAYELWGLTDGRRRMWAGGPFYVTGVL